MARMAAEHRLGWMGTGRMGSALVRRLLAGGCDVAVYNAASANNAHAVR
jgi:3-hydroxyisobutyrate dehydrogenase-like beta-hydroxyacid dehydrogenase